MSAIPRTTAITVRPEDPRAERQVHREIEKLSEKCTALAFLQLTNQNAAEIKQASSVYRDKVSRLRYKRLTFKERNSQIKEYEAEHQQAMALIHRKGKNAQAEHRVWQSFLSNLSQLNKKREKETRRVDMSRPDKQDLQKQFESARAKIKESRDELIANLSELGSDQRVPELKKILDSAYQIESAMSEKYIQLMNPKKDNAPAEHRLWQEFTFDLSQLSKKREEETRGVDMSRPDKQELQKQFESTRAKINKLRDEFIANMGGLALDQRVPRLKKVLDRAYQIESAMSEAYIQLMNLQGDNTQAEHRLRQSFISNLSKLNIRRWKETRKVDMNRPDKQDLQKEFESALAEINDSRDELIANLSQLALDQRVPELKKILDSAYQTECAMSEKYIQLMNG